MILIKHTRFQYHSGWALIACVAGSVATTEEELYLIFLYIIQNIFPKVSFQYISARNSVTFQDFFVNDAEHDYKTIELYRFLVLMKIKMPDLAAALRLESPSGLEARESLSLDVIDYFLKSQVS